MDFPGVRAHRQSAEHKSFLQHLSFPGSSIPEAASKALAKTGNHAQYMYLSKVRRELSRTLFHSGCMLCDS